MRAEREENRKRRAAGARGGWRKGAAVAAADAGRWRYQGTDVNGGKVYLSYVLDLAPHV